MAILSCVNIQKEIEGKRIIQNFTFDFLFDKIYVFSGTEGSGLPELFNIISGRDFDYRGEVYVDEVFSYEKTNFLGNIAYFKSLDEFGKNVTLDDIKEMLDRSFQDFDLNLYETMIKHFGFHYRQKTSSLTEYERKLILDIATLSSNSLISIFDDLAGYTDPKKSNDFIDFLKDSWYSKKRLFLITSKNLDSLKPLMSELLIFDKGVLIESLTIDKIINDFVYLSGTKETLKPLIAKFKVIGYEEYEDEMYACLPSKLKKDDIRLLQRYFIDLKEVPIEKIVIYLLRLREAKEEKKGAY